MSDIIEKLSHPIPCFEDVCDNAQTMHDAVQHIKVLEAKINAQADYIMISNRVNNNLKKKLAEFINE